MLSIYCIIAMISAGHNTSSCNRCEPGVGSVRCRGSNWKQVCHCHHCSREGALHQGNVSRGEQEVIHIFICVLNHGYLPMMPNIATT